MPIGEWTCWSLQIFDSKLANSAGWRGREKGGLLSGCLSTGGCGCLIEVSGRTTLERWKPSRHKIGERTSRWRTSIQEEGVLRHCECVLGDLAPRSCRVESTTSDHRARKERKRGALKKTTYYLESFNCVDMHNARQERWVRWLEVGGWRVV